MGVSHYPLPWQHLRHDTSQDGYVVAMTEDQLKGAPRYNTSEAVDWTDTAWGGRIDDYYRSGRLGVARSEMSGHDAARTGLR